MQTIFFDISNKYAISMEPKPEGGNVALQFKQGNVGQKIKAVINDQATPFVIPNEAKFSVWFSGPGGEGNYSSIGDRSAFVVEDNSVTVEVIAQMLSSPGNGTLCLILNSADGAQLGLWNVVYAVEHVPGMESEAAENYYTSFSELARQAINAAATFETDTTLSASGKAADAASVGAGLAGKAPAGFGLGEGMRNATALSQITVSGYYRVLSSELPDKNAWWGHADMMGETWGTVELVSVAGCRIQCHLIDGTWTTEWVNPPMVPGVEYRTTERFNGLPVYKKWIEYGWLAAGEHALEHGISVNVPLDAQVYNNYAENVTNSQDMAGVYFSRTHITFNRTVPMGNVAVVLKYTKL